MWKFIIGCVIISTQKIMKWLENVVGLFLKNPGKIRFLSLKNEKTQSWLAKAGMNRSLSFGTAIFFGHTSVLAVPVS